MKSVYNFVPINHEVYLLGLHDAVSHDIPKKNSLSGKIEFTLTAKSPIYIGGTEDGRFPNINGRFFIPGSSIRGAVRSVLEILSFAKLRPYNDVKFSVRDFSGKNSHYQLSRFASVKGGWLSKTSNGYKIKYSKDKPGRITHKSLGASLNSFCSAVNQEDSKENFPKNAYDKYVQLEKVNTEEVISFASEKFDLVEEKNYKKIYKKGHEKTGTIVLTGQHIPNNATTKDKKTDEEKEIGKKYEFIFWEANQIEEFFENQPNGEPHPIIKNFLFAYLDHDEKNISNDWKVFRGMLKRGLKIPIFITLKNKKVEHFGLSMAYKIPYDKSTEDLLDEVQSSIQKDRIDLADQIFGNVSNEKLKGRVFFSHAFQKDICTELPARNIVLSSPKPTFYPFYINQYKDRNNVNPYFTYNDGELAGRKRYPVRKNVNLQEFTNNNPKIYSEIKPLAANTSKFRCTAVFHNLDKIEFGALLSSLTFHLQPNKFHSIGMAKPYGYGKTKLTINQLLINGRELNEEFEEEILKYLKDFEIEMKAFLPTWDESPQVKELMAMATESNDHPLAYPELEDFVSYKNNFTALQRYSKLSGFQQNSFSVDDAIEAAHQEKEQRRQEEEEKQRLADEERQRKQDLIKGFADQLPNLVFDDIIVQETKTAAIISSAEKPYKAYIQLDGEYLEINLSLEKWHDPTKLENQKKIEVVITQISEPKRIVTMIKAIKILN